MEHSVTPGALFVDGAVDADRKRARVDDRFVRRLSRSLREAFVDVGIDGIPTLKEGFLKLDRSINETNFDADIWRFKALLKTPTGLPDKDLDLLFDELYRHTDAGIEDDDGDVVGPRVDLAEVMVYFRRVIGHPTAQFHAILKKLRSRRPDFAKSPFNATAHPARVDIFEYLVQQKLTQSESFWILEQCADMGKNEGTPERGAFCNRPLDVDYLVNCLFAFPLPDDIAYPLLLGKVVECVADRLREYNGVSGMQRVMKRVLAGAHGRPDAFSPVHTVKAVAQSAEVTPVPKRHHRFARDDPGVVPDSAAAAADPVTPAPARSGATSAAKFDMGTFRLFAASFGAGLSAAESEMLFQYVADPETGLLCPDTFADLVRARIPLLPRSELMSIVLEVRNAVVNSSFGGLCDLHVALWNAYPDVGALPLQEYCATLRRCGVMPIHAADADLEHLHREAPTIVGLVLLLRGDLTAARTAVLTKLFSRLDPEDAGLVERDRVLACFEPELGDPKVCSRGGERRERLAAYLRTLPPNDGVLSFGEFSYFWGNVSASIVDDADYVMMLWQSYGMQRNGSKLQPQTAAASSARRGRGAAEPASLPRATPLAVTPSPTPRNIVRTSVAMTGHQDAPISCAIPMGDDNTRQPVSRRRVIPGRS